MRENKRGEEERESRKTVSRRVTANTERERVVENEGGERKRGEARMRDKEGAKLYPLNNTKSRGKEL